MASAQTRNRCFPINGGEVPVKDQATTVTILAAFLYNHAGAIASIDLFIVPTITSGMQFGFVVLHHGRRQLVHVGVTAHPTAEWLSHQVSEAFSWNRAPRHLIRDRDRAFGETFKQRLHAMGIRDRPTAPRSPWQNAHVERLIGSIRDPCRAMGCCVGCLISAACIIHSCGYSYS